MITEKSFTTAAELFSWVQKSDFFMVLVACVSAAIGRVLFYAQKIKRKPTLAECILEPFVITMMALVGSGGLKLFNIEDDLVHAAVGALSGFYGTRSFDFVVKVIAAKLGLKNFDPCPVGDDLKANVKNDEPDNKKQT